MTWAPLSEFELWNLINEAESTMRPSLYRLWEAIQIAPEKWQQVPYGQRSGGFWVVAVIGQQVLWYNDIERGFNISVYRQFGVIEEYFCNQDSLVETVQSLQNLLSEGYSLVRAGPP
ncbi:hypothetical protein [Pseudomonas sp. AU12215]|uniref:hypothetical protein n=1 Tax=Pseudomonas sp. AU12215 TaxID=1860123 RepID=UPI000806CF3D|nr:hypothetical protein [Pseudomonas sp. AU12215]OBY58835.1 hypothetical protein A9513_001655 [Pseudomonas sp. AU12215]SNT38387.1 hypothetical protein SAMN05216209_4680 [Pseudomonas nitroreducens]